MTEFLPLVLGWLGSTAIAILSLVPAELRPHVLKIGQLEHFWAYFVTSVAFALAFKTGKRLALVCIALSLLAALLEVAQLWIPGRHSQVIDWVASSLGALVGVASVLVLLWADTKSRRRPAR